MKYIPTDPKLFIDNRARLCKLMQPSSVAIVHSNDVMPTNADGTMGFHQNTDLYYLCGIDQEETILLIAKSPDGKNCREILFIRETNDRLIIWEGHKYTKEQAQKISGISEIYWTREFSQILHVLLPEYDNIYLDTNEHTRNSSEVETRNERWSKLCRKRYPLYNYLRLAPLMYDLRVIKSAIEVDMIKRACDITGKGFNRVLRTLRPGMNEAEVEAEFAYEFIRVKAEFAYGPIIASGENSCVLHYPQNDKECKDGDVLLLDVAAGLGNYMSDLSRTLPISGRFTKRQRDVYDAVLRIYHQVIKEMKPGVSIEDLRQACSAFTEVECLRLGLFTEADLKKQDPQNPLVRKYFMHGVSHSIGLDVHDVMTPNKHCLQPGWVMSCEPGIYIREERLGIRLENTIYLSENGPVNLMSEIPIEADDIEQVMNQGR